MNEDAEEGRRFVVRVRLEVGVDLDNECGGDGGEQTSLLALVRMRPSKTFHKKLTKIRVVFKSSSYFVKNSSSYSSDSLR